MLASLLPPTVWGQVQYERLKSFGFSELSGWSVSSLIEGSDGVLYGTTAYGSSNNCGTVFKLNKDGSGYAQFHTFNGTPGARVAPFALLEGNDKTLYGLTAAGGAANGGTVFKLNKDGGGFLVLHSFGRKPTGMIEASDGSLYGTTDDGYLFKLNKDGSGYTLLHSFGSNLFLEGWPFGLFEGSDGALRAFTVQFDPLNRSETYRFFKLNKDGSGYTFLATSSSGRPNAAIKGSDGVLYLSATEGGLYGGGIVYRMEQDGSNQTSLHSFGSGGARNPIGALVEGRDGVLYGALSTGGPANAGAIFKINKDGSGYTILRNSGEVPLVQGSDGFLYGTGADSVVKLATDGTGFDRLRSFRNTGGDGSIPAKMIEGSDATLYGTTSAGGEAGTGTIFTLKRDGRGYTILHNFATGYWQDPSGLIEASDGALYGTTTYASNSGYGTVFRLNRDGSGFTIVYAFTGAGGDGSHPTGVIEASDGVLYGTTTHGGTNFSGNFNGTVFKLNKDGSGYGLLHLFNYPNGDGSQPNAPPIEGIDGTLYGTTIYGGGGFDPGTGVGTVFKLNKDGSAYVVLHIFKGDDGEGLYTSLLQASDGVLYGSTEWAGAAGYGTLFRLNTDGSGFKVLRVFSAFDTEGRGVSSPLVEGPDGTLYGTTSLYGASGRGTVFKLNKDGSGYRVLRRFTGVDKDGNTPTSLVKGSDGSFYGLTAKGGDMDFGSVFVMRMQRPAMMPPIVSAQSVKVLFRSDPGSIDQIQRTSTLGGNWLTLTNVVVPTNGTAEFIDSSPLHPSGFYRVTRPSP